MNRGTSSRPAKERRGSFAQPTIKSSLQHDHIGVNDSDTESQHSSSSPTSSSVHTVPPSFSPKGGLEFMERYQQRRKERDADTKTKATNNTNNSSKQEEILAKIQQLQFQLNQVKMEEEEGLFNKFTQQRSAMDARDSAPRMKGQRLIVVSNRLPVTITKLSDGTYDYRMSSGGLVTAFAGVKNSFPFLWVGWPGAEVDPLDQEMVSKHLLDKYQCFPVYLTNETADMYYNGFCNDVLWPLFHYVPVNVVSIEGVRKFNHNFWQAYKIANRKFTEAVIQVHNPNDLVWVQDYHLMIMPTMLKKAIEDITIGFFFHTPFPSSEVYRILPVRRQVLEGLLAADLIGFHTYDYARHFLSVCTRLLGLATSPTGVDCVSHFAHVGIFPIGIDPQNFENALKTDYVYSRLNDLREKFAGKKVLLGVDRLDYIKGVPHKLLAFELLLSKYPEWKDKAVLVQIAVPTRTEVEEYKKLSARTNELIGRIIGKYSSVSQSPIVFINQFVKFDDLCALYALADVLLVTSIRDGMNLVSYEFVACQKEGHGVLVLSEFAGCAQSLSGAIRINPWNIDELAEALNDALSMPPRERELKHRKLYRYVTQHTARYWAQSFVAELETLYKKALDEKLATTYSRPLLRPDIHIIPQISNSKLRLFLFGYEGVFCPYQALAELSAPNSTMKRYLTRLASDPKNLIYVISSRSREVVESWFGDIRMGLIAEQGCFVRHIESQDWIQINTKQDESWKHDVIPIFQYFTERTPGSHLEIKENVITWHFKDSDLRFGSWQANELRVHLLELCVNLPVEPISWEKMIELRPVGLNHVEVLGKIIEYHDNDGMLIDFVFALGSERADEELFTYLANLNKENTNLNVLRTSYGSELSNGVGTSNIINHVTCTVGARKSHAADFYLQDTERALSLLRVISSTFSDESQKKPRKTTRDKTPESTLEEIF